MRLSVIIFTSITLWLAVSCMDSAKRTSGLKSSGAETDTTLLVFDKELHNFGKVQAGEEIACRFGFTNMGEKSLVIDDVVAGCGCTNVKYPHKPVSPGEKGAVEIVFNTSGRNGHQRQVVRVISNGSRYPVELVIRAEVE